MTTQFCRVSVALLCREVKLQDASDSADGRYMYGQIPVLAALFNLASFRDSR